MKTLSVGIFVMLGAMLGGCATSPSRMEELFPYGTNPYEFTRNSRGNPGSLAIQLEGEQACNIVIFDRAGRVVDDEVIGDRGDPTSTFFEGRTRIRTYGPKKILEPGPYLIRAVSFHYYTPILGKRRISPPQEQEFAFVIPSRADDMVFDDATQRYWGAVVRIHTGNIPDGERYSPTINASCGGIICDIMDGLGLRGGVVRQ